MASKILDLVIKVNDQASKALDEIKGSTSGDGKGAQGLSEALLATAGYGVMAGMALQKIGKFTSENIDEFTDYVLGVDALADAFGLSVEEAEQVILASDAFGVSNDALFSTLNKLTREGLGTGTEALENLREGFQDVEDPADRAQYLFGMAGEQGQKVLAPMLAMSELEWNALMDGIESLTKVDEEMVGNARELEIASQGIEQAWNGLKITMLNWAAPGLTGLLELLQRPLNPDSAAQFLIDMGWGVDNSVGPMVSDAQPAGLGRLSEGQPGGALGGSDELTQMIRDLPSNISDAIERSSTGLGH